MALWRRQGSTLLADACKTFEIYELSGSQPRWVKLTIRPKPLINFTQQIITKITAKGILNPQRRESCQLLESSAWGCTDSYIYVWQLQVRERLLKAVGKVENLNAESQIVQSKSEKSWERKKKNRNVLFMNYKLQRGQFTSFFLRNLIFRKSSKIQWNSKYSRTRFKHTHTYIQRLGIASAKVCFAQPNCAFKATLVCWITSILARKFSPKVNSVCPFYLYAGSIGAANQRRTRRSYGRFTKN